MSTQLIKLLLPLLLCFSAIAMGYIFIQHTHSQGLIQALSRYHELFDIWHLILYIIFIFSWPYFIQYKAKQRHWNDSMANTLTRQRIKIAVFFILIEIFIVHNALGHFISWIFR